MKTKKLLLLIALPTVLLLGFSGCDTLSMTSVSAQVRYDNPRWAPPYYEGVRYYYIPDIEIYFDLSRHEFIYLQDGRWFSSPYLPQFYAGFDLDNCFSIALSINVFKPWMHHQYYISHYPRYYYRDYYDHRNIPYVRGFNENNRRPFFWRENERHRARKWDDEGLRENRKFRYERYDNDVYDKGNRSDQGRRPSTNGRQQDYQKQDNDRQQPYNRPDNNVTQPQTPKQGGYDNRQQPTNRQDNNNVTRPQGNRDNNYQPQQRQGDNAVNQQRGNTEREQQRNVNAETRSPNYYGRQIGQPVKVERQMREPRSTQPAATRGQSDNKSDKENKEGSSGRGRR